MSNIYKVTLHHGDKLYYDASNIATVLYHLTQEKFCPACDIVAIEKVKRIPKDEIVLQAD